MKKLPTYKRIVGDSAKVMTFSHIINRGGFDYALYRTKAGSHILIPIDLTAYGESTVDVTDLGKYRERTIKRREALGLQVTPKK